jgi:hypothetical protein
MSVTLTSVRRKYEREGNLMVPKAEPPSIQDLITYALSRGELLSTVIARCGLQQPQPAQRE